MYRSEIFDIRKQKRKLSIIKRAQGGREFVYPTNRTFS